MSNVFIVSYFNNIAKFSFLVVEYKSSDEDLSMKKIFLLVAILFVSVLTTACINNFAVQELNNKAKESLNNGETETAICRLKSSLDLDSNMYETHYNLAVAYIAGKQYDEAIKSLEQVVKLKPDFADTYYSLGLAYEELAAQATSETEEDSKTSDKVIDKQAAFDNISKAIENYNQYLSRKIDASDKDKVNERINYLNEELKKYNVEEPLSDKE